MIEFKTKIVEILSKKFILDQKLFVQKISVQINENFYIIVELK